MKVMIAIRCRLFRASLMAICGMAGACTLLSSDRERQSFYSLTAKSAGPEELSEVEVISGDRSFGFGHVAMGEKSVYPSPFSPNEPWTLVWRDAKQRLHVVPLKIDPAKVPPQGTVILEIHATDVKVIYEERTHHDD